MIDSEIEDDFENEYIDHLFRASKHLEKLVQSIDKENGQRVFIYDTNAVLEAPAAIIVYLALFCRHSDWNDIEALKTYVKSYNKQIMPNMPIIAKCILKYKDFQNEQRELRRKEEEERLRLEAEEAKRRALQKAKEEAERLRLLKLAAEE